MATRQFRRLQLTFLKPASRLGDIVCADITYLPPLGRFAVQIACQATDTARVPLSGGNPLPDRVMRSMIPKGVDSYSRKVLAWRLSNSMDADFCVETLKDALVKHAKPEIMNTDSHIMVTSSRVV